MSTLAVETGDFAQELYSFLRTLDRPPAEEVASSLRDRIERLRERCRVLVESVAQDEAVAALVRTLEAILAALEDLRARLSRGWSASALASFRGAAAPHYEALAARLRALRVQAPTLRPANLKRSAYHVANGFFAAACIAWLPSWTWIRVVAGAFLAFAVIMELGRRRSALWNRFAMRLFGAVAHPHEEHRVNSGTFYAVALFTLAVFSGPVPSLLAVLALGLGDPAAAFVGRRWGRTRLIAGRSLEGTLAFATVAFGICLAALSLLHPELGAGLRVALALSSGVVGAVVELVSGRVDDNLSIPLSVAAAAHLVLVLA